MAANRLAQASLQCKATVCHHLVRGTVNFACKHYFPLKQFTFIYIKVHIWYNFGSCFKSFFQNKQTVTTSWIYVHSIPVLSSVALSMEVVPSSLVQSNPSFVLLTEKLKKLLLCSIYIRFRYIWKNIRHILVCRGSGVSSKPMILRTDETTHPLAC